MEKEKLDKRAFKVFKLHILSGRKKAVRELDYLRRALSAEDYLHISMKYVEEIHNYIKQGGDK